MRSPRPERPVPGPQLSRRAVTLTGLALAGSALAGCRSTDWHGTDVTGSSPRLRFSMTRVNDGQLVRADDYRGKLVLLYFGYTFCPDVCPLTLANIASVLGELGPDAERVRVLFVTVDPGRDTPGELAQYVDLFAPEVDGLRGTGDQIAALARRYRVVYSVDPGTGDEPYEVSHSAAVYAFDASGAARVLYSNLGSAAADIDGIAGDLKRLIGEAGS